MIGRSVSSIYDNKKWKGRYLLIMNFNYKTKRFALQKIKKINKLFFFCECNLVTCSVTCYQFIHGLTHKFQEI